MIVVSDTSPLNYLVLIQCADLLPQLFGRVAAPPEVITELLHVRAPIAVRAWASSPPAWLEVVATQAPPMELSLGPGEAAALRWPSSCTLTRCSSTNARVQPLRPGRAWSLRGRSPSSIWRRSKSCLSFLRSSNGCDKRRSACRNWSSTRCCGATPSVASTVGSDIRHPAFGFSSTQRVTIPQLSLKYRHDEGKNVRYRLYVCTSTRRRASSLWATSRSNHERSVSR